jgi:hypothetical protein
MQDSNWKKLVVMGESTAIVKGFLHSIWRWIVKSLKAKFNKAVLAQKENGHVLNDLDCSLSSEVKKKWLDTEELAMQHRGHYLEIYAVNPEQGEDCMCVILVILLLIYIVCKSTSKF